MTQPFGTWSVDITANTDPLKRSLDEAGRLGDQFASRLTGAFEAVALHGRKVEDVVRSLMLSLSNMALKAAFKPFEDLLGSAFNGLLAPAFGGSSAAPALPVPFAKGGVIAAPATFPLPGGHSGLAGERGAEAILPLARGPDGRLGVRADGQSAGVNITLNIATPDAQSFRRTQTQLAAMLHRVAGTGQRNL